MFLPSIHSRQMTFVLVSVHVKHHVLETDLPKPASTRCSVLSSFENLWSSHRLLHEPTPVSSLLANKATSLTGCSIVPHCFYSLWLSHALSKERRARSPLVSHSLFSLSQSQHISTFFSHATQIATTLIFQLST